MDSDHDLIVPSSSDQRPGRAPDWTKGPRFIPNEGEPDTCVQKVVQQRLSGTPVLFNAKCGIFLFSALMVIFIALGAVLWSAAADIVSYSSKYGPTEYNGVKIGDDRAQWNQEVSVLSFTVSQHMSRPIHVQYHLSGFFQNHRRYRKSVSWSQLVGNPDNSLKSDCAFWLHDKKDRIWYPCGLIGRSVFSDFFMVYKKESDATEWTKIRIESSRDKIIDSSLRVDKLFRPPNDVMQDANVNYWIYFQFPPQRCLPILNSSAIDALTTSTTTNIQQLYVASVVDTEQPDCNVVGESAAERKCNFTRSLGTSGTSCGVGDLSDYETVPVLDFGVSSPHFINWFYLAAFPNFHKLWGIIEEDIPVGTELKVVIFDNFDVASFKGEKKFVITTTNWIGTDDYDIAIAYFTTAGLCLLATVYLTCIWVKRPRLESSIALDFVQPS